jgi:hypothetical protein
MRLILTDLGLVATLLAASLHPAEARPGATAPEIARPDRGTTKGYRGFRYRPYAAGYKVAAVDIATVRWTDARGRSQTTYMRKADLPRFQREIIAGNRATVTATSVAPVGSRWMPLFPGH